VRVAPPVRVPTLAQRALELRALAIPQSQIRLLQGRQLQFDFTLAPNVFSRQYQCRLVVMPAGAPLMFVIEPDLRELAAGRPLLHTYKYDGPGTLLCLWLPRKNEWMPQMRLLETYIAWTAQWLDCFEQWLVTDAWAWEGEHPQPRKKRRR
jgi:hypothetical protein